MNAAPSSPVECEVPTFKCPRWPHCDCPGGTTRPECPQHGGEIEDDGFITVHPPLNGHSHA